MDFKMSNMTVAIGESETTLKLLIWMDERQIKTLIHNKTDVVQRMIQNVWMCISMFNYFFNIQNHLLEKNMLLRLSYGMPIAYSDRYANKSGYRRKFHGLKTHRASPDGAYGSTLDGGCQFIIRNAPRWTIVRNFPHFSVAVISH